MKDDTLLNNLTAEDKEEYLEITAQIKQEFKKKIQSEIEVVRKDLAEQTAHLLGVEFATLLNDRKNLLQVFKDSGKKLLLYAKECGLTAELKNLENWSMEAQKNEQTKSEGNKLFSDIIDLVALRNPTLATEVKNIQAELNKNNQLLLQAVKDKKPQLDRVQKDKKLALQKIIVEIILQFNQKIAVVNKSFGIKADKPISPFDDKDKDAILVESEISADIKEDFADELFIPLTGGDDDLN